MTNITRRTFLRRMTVGAGTLTVAMNGGFEYVNAAAGPEVFRIRVLHVNDHHSRLDATAETLASGVAVNHGGVPRRKAYIDSVRATEAAANRELLVLDAGDVFQGTLFYNLFKGYADLDFYRRIGIDAMTVGNHEFDDGPANLARFIEGATTGNYTPVPAGAPTTSLVGVGTNFPVISANITVAAGSPLAGKIPASTVVTKIMNTIPRKIGIFGLTPRETKDLSSPGADVTFSEPNAAAATAITGLQGQAVDGIIGLTHIGYTADLNLAANSRNVYVIIGGHSHTPLGPQPRSAGSYPTLATNLDGETVLIVTDWEWGRWVGDITVAFDAQGKIVTASSTGIPVEMIADSTKPGHIVPDVTLAALLGRPERPATATTPLVPATGYYVPIATLSATAVGSTTVALDGDRANIRNRETNLANLVADAMLFKTKADAAQVTYPSVALTNSGGIRATIAKGNINFGNVLTVLPFGNTIARVDLTGFQLRTAISIGLDQINATTPSSSGGRFPAVAGMRFIYNPLFPAGSRLRALFIRKVTGTGASAVVTFVPVDDLSLYRVYTNNFMLTGGDGYTVLAQGSNRLDIGFLLADALAEYIREFSPIDATKIAGGRALGRSRNLPLLGTVPAATPTP